MNKRFSAIVAVITLSALIFAGCGNSEAEKAKESRILYSKVQLEDYVELGEYKSITVDTGSDEYKSTYEELIYSDASDNEFFVDKGTAAIEDGDIANIDYIGKKDGVAFDGGTAQGYDLQIGSDSFIDGFEDGLIGASAGKALDLNLKFPEEYSNSELAGKEVVFTVIVNSVKTPEKPEVFFGKLDFKSVDAYYADTKARAVKQLLLKKFNEKIKVKEYPKEDYDMLLETVENQFDSRIQSQYGINLETYLQYTGGTTEEFRAQMASEVLKPMMDEQLGVYALLDSEGIALTSKDTEAQLNKLKEEYDDVTEEELKKFYGDYYFEALAASEKAADYLYKNSKIK